MKQFLVYKSSAGSGKTFNLVKEYLLLALKEPTDADSRPFTRIMAVTFTNKAAAEMKERIIKTLRAIQEGNSHSGNLTMSKLLCQGLEISEVELKQRSARVLSDILHHYSDFSISTIDAFVHRIVRTFANDLHLPMNFSIETDEEFYLKESIHRLLDDFGEDQSLTKFVLEFSQYSVEKGRRWNPDQSIFEYLKIFFNEKNDLARKKIEGQQLEEFNRIRSKLNGLIEKKKAVFLKCGNEAFELMQSAGLEVNDFLNGKSGVIGIFIKLRNLHFDKPLVGARVLDALNDDKWFTKGNHNAEALFAPINESMKAKLKEAVDLTEEVKSLLFVEKIQSNLFALALLNSVQELLQEIKAERNFIFIREFNQKIAQIVFHEPVPFLYERLGERYKNFLVDEFQDTNFLQWNNLLPLVDNALSEGERCLVVGDAKQSIYRWRGAEVEQFIKLPSIKESETNPVLKSREDTLIRNFEEVVLSSNFRSKTEVVQFNNELFQFLSDNLTNDVNKSVYETLHQESDNSNTGGLVILDYYLIKKAKNSKDKKDKDQEEEVEENAEEEEFELDETLFLKVKEAIADAVQQGFRYADIALLVRTNKTGSKLASFIESQNIPVVSSESLLLTECAEVVLILQVLKLILNPSDQVSAASFLKQLANLNNLSASELSEWLMNFSKKPDLNSVQSNVQSLYPQFYFNSYNELSLWDQCAGIIRDLKLMQRNAVYCAFFLEEVQRFLQTMQTDLFSFLNYWEERKSKASVIIPADLDAVRVMTIHTSKGLEFPVVILPEMNWTKRENDKVWVDLNISELEDLRGIMLPGNSKNVPKEYESVFMHEKAFVELDDLNLMYVACTRAIQRLHILSFQKIKSNVSSWLEQFLSGKINLELQWNRWVFGDVVPVKSKFTSKIDPDQISPELILWHDRMNIKLDGNLSWEAEKLNPREKGNIIHEVLATSHNLETAFNKLRVLTNAGRMNEQEQEELSKQLVEIFQHPDFQFLFDSSYRMLNERELLSAHGEIYRPDRLMMKGDELILVDFKTGEKRNSHLNQMKNYIQVLKDAGANQLRTYLIYTDTLQSVEI